MNVSTIDGKGSASMSTHEPTKGIVFYRSEEARPLDDDGMMSPPDIPEEVYTTLDLAPIAAGQRVTVLFKGDGPNGFSLIHSWFGPGFRLPRHSHSADCLYSVLSGEVTMGRRVIKAGEGFFVKADAPYAYEAGPDGTEVLEFRVATSFDMKIFDRTVERWKPIVDAAVANRDQWEANTS
jgi:quercetin dioxygenase-like cupin family protein